jgi:hypothetical protein
MDRQQFWDMVEAAKSGSDGDCSRQAELVLEALQELSIDDIVSFDWILGQLQAESYRADLWAAAYLIHGGCSDDGFEYFRGWLIAQGRELFESVLHDPDLLASRPEVLDGPDPSRNLWCEKILGVADAAFEAVTGREPTVDDFDIINDMPDPAVAPDWSVRDIDDVACGLPHLWELFGKPDQHTK